MILVASSRVDRVLPRGESGEVRDIVFSAIRDNQPATNGVILVETS